MSGAAARTGDLKKIEIIYVPVLNRGIMGIKFTESVASVNKYIMIQIDSSRDP